MNALLSCPWCGKTPTEICLSEGSTSRWAICSPDCCGEVMGEIRRDSGSRELKCPENVAEAIRWWNTRKVCKTCWALSPKREGKEREAV